jgi:predicted nicotinamide N-methyase
VGADAPTGDLREEVVALNGRTLSLLRPPDSDALLIEEAFEREELLPYWAELWASGVALADALAPRALRGVRALELGCGLGLVSLAAARSGARVTASDWSAAATAMAALNADRNGIELETLVCAWERPDAIVERAPWPLVLASDVLYERVKADLLTDLLPRLVDARGEILLADPGRTPAPGFLEAAAASFTVRSSASARMPHVTIHRLRLH